MSLRELLTTGLDLIGALLLIVAVSLFVATWTVPGAVGVAGVLLLAGSWLLDWKASR